MKIILYNNDNKVLLVIENKNEIEVNGNNIKWEDGLLNNIKHNFIIIDNEYDVNVDDDISPLLEFDKKDKYKYVDKKYLIAKNEQLERDLLNTMNVLYDLYLKVNQQ